MRPHQASPRADKPGAQTGCAGFREGRVDAVLRGHTVRMSTEMKVALLSGAVSLGVAIFTFLASRRARAAEERSQRDILRLTHQLERDAKVEDSLREARAVVDRYRRPLLASAVELRSRLGNIRHNNFLVYLPRTSHATLRDGRAHDAVSDRQLLRLARVSRTGTHVLAVRR